MTTRKTRFTQGAALLREDVVTPLHHHDEAKDTLAVEIDGEHRSMTACEADGYITETYGLPELTDVEHVDGGPRRVRRRHILQGAAAGFGGLLTATALPRYSFAAPTEPSAGPPHLLVCVFMRGGFDGLSAVVPVGDPAYYAARGSIAVRPEDTIALDSRWGLNRNMSALQGMWDAGDLAVIQGSGTPDVSRSHFQDQASVERAAPANVRSGWLGRHLQTSSSATGTFRGITIGSSTVFSLATSALDTLAVSSIDAAELTAWGSAPLRNGVRGVLEDMYGSAAGQAQEQATATFSALDTLQRIRTTTPAGAHNGASYPSSEWGRGLSEIARLARANVGVEVACIDIGDWDMHFNVGSAADQAGWFSRRSRDFAQGLAAFRQDLGDRWATTTVVTMSEFGRRVGANGSGGLDHGQGNTMFVAGGGVHGGRVLGSTPTLEAGNLVQGDVPITLDYRQALSEIVGQKLGNGGRIAEVFPGFTPGASLGLV